MAITNITSQFPDVNEYDRVYSSDSGYAVKVRTEDISPSPSQIGFRITGSWVDEATGAAKAFGDDYFIVEPHEVLIRPDSETDLAQVVEDGRLLMVRRVEAAAINYAAREALTGIKPKS